MTRDDEWEIRAKGTFEGGSQGTTSLYYFLFNKGTWQRHWIRKEDMGVIPRHVFHKWSPQECKAFFKNKEQDAADNIPARLLRSNIASAARRGKLAPWGGHIDAVCASASECKRVEKELESMQYRDPHFQNPVVEGYTLLESTKPFIIIDRHGRKCYRPALAYVLGSPTVFNRDVQSMLESATITQLSSLLRKQHGIDIVRKGFSNLHNEYLSLLQNKVGMYLLISATPSGSRHYSVYDAFRGVLYYGTGIVVTIEDSDLASRASAKAVFESQGLLDIRAVGLFKRVRAKRNTPSSRSRRSKRKLQKKALQPKQDGGGEDAAEEAKEEATTAISKRNATKKRMRARRREQVGRGEEVRKKNTREETREEKCEETPACENLAEPSCRLSMQLGCGMQSEEAQYTAAAGRKPRSRRLSLQGATKARKVARARKEAEFALSCSEEVLSDRLLEANPGGEVHGPSMGWKHDPAGSCCS